MDDEVGVEEAPEAGLLESAVDLLVGHGTGIGDDPQSGAAPPEVLEHPRDVGMDAEVLDPVPTRRERHRGQRAADVEEGDRGGRRAHRGS